MSRTNTRRFLLATASLLVASVSQPSFAQVASTPDQQPSPAVAKAANPQEDAIGDIVVTATKRLGQTNQRTPIAVTAIDAAGLENAHVQSISELTKMVPNVNLNSSVAVPGINNFSIRGMGIYSTIPSSTPTVGIFIDGIYVGANAGSALQNAFDLDGLEVLRGPQGLLFGRNVTAGAILIRTSEPTDHLKIGAQLGVESGPDVTGSVVVSGPLTDDGKLSAKIAAFYNKDFGYFTNLYNGNRHFGKSATSTVRGALAYRPDDSFTAILRFEDGHSDGDGPAGQNHYKYDRNSFDFAIDNEGFNRADWTNATFEMRKDVAFGDGQIVNLFGWRRINTGTSSDIDATTVVTYNLYQFLRQNQWSNELRYSGTLGPVAATVGAFYYSDHMNYIEARDLVANAVHRTGGGVQASETYALFSSFDIKLPLDFTLNLGARYSGETKHAQVQVVGDNGPANPCSTVTQRCGSFGFSDSHTWNSFTPKVGFQWQPAASTNLYAFWTKGFRSGGYNVRQTALTSPPGPYDQEVETTFELGLKQSAFQKKARVGISLFKNKYRNLQRDLAFNDAVLGLIQTTLNTADVTVSGVELEGSFIVAHGLTLTANGGYLHSKIDRLRRALTSDGIITPSQYNLVLPFLSKFSYGASVVYMRDIGANKLTSNLSYQHSDAAFSNDLNINKLNPINVLDGSLALEIGGTGISVSAYAKNMLNKVYFGLNNNIGVPPSTLAPLGKGRVLGLEMRFKY